MVWFRVDDVLPFHARVLEAGNAAMGLWVRAGALSAGQLTDGFITTATAKQLGSTREIKRLVDVGLWLHVDGGYQFHAWAEDGTGTKRQPTRAEVEAQRKAERDRKAAYRESLKDGRKPSGTTTPGRPKGVPAGVPAGQPKGHPTDVPPESQQASGHPDPTRPDPESSNEDSAEAKPRKRATRIPDEFFITPEMRSWAADRTPNVDIRLATERFVNHWRAKAGRDATKLDWEATWHNWLLNDAERATQRPATKLSKDDRARETIRLGAELASEQAAKNNQLAGGDFLQLRAIS